MNCMIWLRTSTDKQETDSMLSDLYSFAQQYGYTKEDCTVLIISLILPASGLSDSREGVSEVKGEVSDFLHF